RTVVGIPKGVHRLEAYSTSTNHYFDRYLDFYTDWEWTLCPGAPPSAPPPHAFTSSPACSACVSSAGNSWRWCITRTA
ncbi:hypothetical protein, partial [Calidithermus terrae]|uniref:hypothetical protein n=1 Tax=Calidithermus terrae TaxID=1408545 RepID=UPI001C3FF1BD